MEKRHFLAHMIEKAWRDRRAQTMSSRPIFLLLPSRALFVGRSLRLYVMAPRTAV